MKEDTLLIQQEVLKETCAKLLQAVSVNKEDAEVTADVITCAELRGISSHGIARMPVYLKRLKMGLINANPQIKIESSYNAAAVVDGDNGLGPVITARAMEKAIEMASSEGVGMVGVKKSNHFGVAAYYVMQAMKKDMVGLVITNSSPAIAPFGGKRPLLGTNPMAVGIPGRDGANIIVDMASSVTARGKIRLCATKGEPLPPECALDEEGNPTCDPEKALHGSLVPMGGVKGYALAVLIDLLAGMLTGSGYSDGVRELTDFSGPVNAGHLLMAVKIDAFNDTENFKGQIYEYVSRLHDEPKAGNVKNIYAPGEIEQNLTAERQKSGIPFTHSQVDSLKNMAEEYNAAIPELKG
ncbi:MAG: Ldh family oxidoreductase [Bacillota bacterium]|nr:Ldh family oxidoreductase [Bacillota bacterium]